MFSLISFAHDTTILGNYQEFSQGAEAVKEKMEKFKDQNNEDKGETARISNIF